ncbi:uncharacterized protein F4812DRAFT_319177 [Daldinia caldariorum]|uniref:uncharacterized protein n=1 Tax=Daldinia caldariorum TaxID=326644 RepID=UPI002007A46F|nr:uncharacterized protein F4812DRAFT_319177 [Daldinia caldariorum]KAI1469092.1 hypothetical protein F4812DRAFT_319177 [Daldinia caldariorum]
MEIFTALRILLKLAEIWIPGDDKFMNSIKQNKGTEPDSYCGCSSSLPTLGPWPGHTYKIRDPETKRQITLVNGELRVEKDLGDQGGYHWVCIERDGYLGFLSPTTHVYMGHNNWGQFVAREYHHWAWEFFNTRAHPDGGQVLLTVHGNKMRKMAIQKGTWKLVETEGEGTAWEFVEVRTESD